MPARNHNNKKQNSRSSNSRHSRKRDGPRPRAYNRSKVQARGVDGFEQGSNFIPLGSGPEPKNVHKVKEGRIKKKKESKGKKNKGSSKGVGDLSPTEDDDLVEANSEHQKNGVDGTSPNISPETKNGRKAKDRFIVFVGNLHYSTTTESLKSHFSSIHPDEIRHLTERDHNKDVRKGESEPQKSKGYAFLEFSSFDRMRTCLKLYHHSMFAPDQETQPRKINVELTSGGGGNSTARKKKLEEKNRKLQGERKRDVEKHKRQQVERQKKGAEEGLNNQMDGQRQSMTEVSKGKVHHGDLSNGSSIHPSRLAMLGKR